MSRDTTASLSAGSGRRDFLAAASVALSGGLAGCTGVFAAEGNNVNIAGSSTVFPVTEAIASAFSEENPTVNLSLSKTGTGGGFGNFFCAGRTDINNASRAIADAEVEQCDGSGVTPLEFPIATDALTVVANPEPTGSTVSPSNSYKRSGRPTAPSAGAISTRSGQTRSSNSTALRRRRARSITSTRRFSARS